MILRLPSSQTRSLFATQLETINRSIDEFNIILEIDNIATIKDLVLKEQGISILPKSVCYHELKNHSLAVRPIENMTMIRQINIVFLKDFTDHHILDELVKLYHELVL